MHHQPESAQAPEWDPDIRLVCTHRKDGTARAPADANHRQPPDETGQHPPEKLLLDGKAKASKQQPTAEKHDFLEFKRVGL